MRSRVVSTIMSFSHAARNLLPRAGVAGAGGSATPHHAAAFRRRAGGVLLILLVVVAWLNIEGSSSLENSGTAVYAPAAVRYDTRYDDAHSDLRKRDGGSTVFDARQRADAVGASTPEAKYCNMTNPPLDRAANDVRCLTRASALGAAAAGGGDGVVKSVVEDAFLIVATVSEASLWEPATGRCNIAHLSWMAEIAVPIVVFVKSNATKSFRQSNNTWTDKNHYTARSAQRMHFGLNTAAAGNNKEHDTAPQAVFRSILRDAWEGAQQLSPIDGARADGAAPVAEEGGGDAATTAAPPPQPSFGQCVGGDWMTKKLSTASDLFIFEAPNVGDEAASFIEIALRLSYVADGNNEVRQAQQISDDDRVKLASLDGILGKVEYVIVVHDHASSWHGLRLVEQLSCLCMDASSGERYRTLSSPSKAYLMQCMPLVVNTTDMLANVLARAPPAAARNAEFAAFHRRNVRRTAALSEGFYRALKYLVTLEAPGASTTVEQRMPQAIVRDCCSTFVASRAAVLGHGGTETSGGWRSLLPEGSTTTASQFWENIHNKVLTQPLGAERYAPSVATGHDESELRVGELSMYLERFWRTLLGATEFETQRDVVIGHCAHVDSVAFECPPFKTVKIGGDGLLPDVKRDISSGKLLCSSEYAVGNVFQSKR